jgi:thymidylate synthase (FAD)
MLRKLNPTVLIFLSSMPLSDADILREPRVTVLARPQFAEPAHMPVQWMGDATDGERLAEFAGRLSSMSQRNPAGRTTREYLANIRTQAHGSILEHATYSLLLEGISRSLSHELLRHETGLAHTQLSQRHVDERDARFVLPPATIGNASLEAAWRAQMSAALDGYVALVDALMSRYAWIDDKVHRRKLAREAACGVLPNSTETKLVITGHARAWRSMLALLASENADLESRRLAVVILRLLQTEAPAFFGDFEIHVASDRREAARVTHHNV